MFQIESLNKFGFGTFPNISNINFNSMECSISMGVLTDKEIEKKKEREAKGLNNVAVIYKLDFESSDNATKLIPVWQDGEDVYKAQRFIRNLGDDGPGVEVKTKSKKSKEKKDIETFEGFKHFDINHVNYDITHKVKNITDGLELAFTSLVANKILMWNKSFDYISSSQLQKDLKLSRPKVISLSKSVHDKKIILSYLDESKKGYEKRYYFLNTTVYSVVVEALEKELITMSELIKFDSKFKHQLNKIKYQCEETKNANADILYNNFRNQRDKEYLELSLKIKADLDILIGGGSKRDLLGGYFLFTRVVNEVNRGSKPRLHTTDIYIRDNNKRDKQQTDKEKVETLTQEKKEAAKEENKNVVVDSLKVLVKEENKNKFSESKDLNSNQSSISKDNDLLQNKDGLSTEGKENVGTGEDKNIPPAPPVNSYIMNTSKSIQNLYKKYKFDKKTYELLVLFENAKNAEGQNINFDLETALDLIQTSPEKVIKTQLSYLPHKYDKNGKPIGAGYLIKLIKAGSLEAPAGYTNNVQKEKERKEIELYTKIGGIWGYQGKVYNINMAYYEINKIINNQFSNKIDEIRKRVAETAKYIDPSEVIKRDYLDIIEAV